MNRQRRVLIVDDEESICWGLSKLCTKLSLAFETASSAEAGLRLAEDGAFQVVFLDVRLPGMDGLTAIKEFHARLGPVPIITITAFGDLKTAITSIQNGAFEYITKPFELEQVQEVLQQAVTSWELAQLKQDGGDEDQDTTALASAGGESGMIGTSAIMQQVFKQIALTTTTESPVLISGESGTGKELAARAIHRFSARANGPFVAVNIASLSPSLAESELFGHVKGAFTGAENGRKGVIEQAEGGTLFLDEVAEIPLEIQVKLLRVLDQGEITPVGSNQAIKTNFRLLSATHQDLLEQVNHGDFRHDLLYRLRTIEIRLPALRDHREDIPLLARHFLSQHDSSPSLIISPEFLDELRKRHWAGNIRELRNVVERAAILARGGVLTSDHIESLDPEGVAGRPAQGTQQRLSQLASDWLRQNWEEDSEMLYDDFLAIVEPAVFMAAYELSGGQYSAAARKLGIHRTTLKKKLDDWGS